MPVYRRMPVIAAIKGRRQYSWWDRICIAIQRVADVIWVFFVNARERQISEPLRSVDVKLWRHSGCFGTRNVRRKEQKSGAKCGLHGAATLNEISAGLKRPFSGRPALSASPV
jgi:hypothetical protein